MYLLNDPNRRYFINEVGLKAQIARLEDGRFCLTRYSYPDKVMHNQVVEQHITDTFEEAVEILDKHYGEDSFYGKDNPDFHMHEVSYDDFIATFAEEDKLYSLNAGGTISLSNCRLGYTYGIRVKVGRKELLLDVYKQKKKAKVSLYGGNRRRSVLLLKPDAFISKGLIENWSEIASAQKVTMKYEYFLA